MDTFDRALYFADRKNRRSHAGRDAGRFSSSTHKMLRPFSHPCVPVASCFFT